MTSNINPNNIDGAYPVAGQDNNSQGFRDNFTNTKTNFEYASAEITDLQNKAVLKSALTGTTLNNDMGGSILSNFQGQNISGTVVALGTLSGAVGINYAAGSYQTVTTAGSISLAFTNFTASGTQDSVIVQVTITNTAYTMTLPSAVGSGAAAQSAATIQGLDTNTNVLTFGETGTYLFQFITADNGSTIYILDLTRSRTVTIENGGISITDTTQSTSPTTGSIVTDGGIGLAKDLFSGGNVTANGYVSTTSVYASSTVSVGTTSTSSALIVSSQSGNIANTTSTVGTVVQVSGTDGSPSRVTIDSFGANVYTALTGRMARGNLVVPDQTLANDIFLSVTGRGYSSGVTGFGANSTALISLVAAEDITDSARGSFISLQTTANSSITPIERVRISETGTLSAVGNIVGAGVAFLTSSEDLAASGAANLAVTASYFTTAAAETATLAAGTNGQIKTFAAVDIASGDMVITVSNAGWQASGTGTITFNTRGDACTLQYINSKWFCIGNNGCVFG